MVLQGPGLAAASARLGAMWPVLYEGCALEKKKKKGCVLALSLGFRRQNKALLGLQDLSSGSLEIPGSGWCLAAGG